MAYGATVGMLAHVPKQHNRCYWFSVVLGDPNSRHAATYVAEDMHQEGNNSFTRNPQQGQSCAESVVRCDP